MSSADIGAPGQLGASTDSSITTARASSPGPAPGDGADGVDAPEPTGPSAMRESAAPHDPEAGKLSPGDPDHGRMRLALFAAGLATFALLYSTQALLPQISHDLHAAPTEASWTVSGATIGLAVAVLPLAALSERFGRRKMLTLSMAVAVALAVAIPFAPSIGTLIVLRSLQGASIAGVAVSAMAFLADEVRAKYLVGATGLFVAGNSVGGMSGRVLSGWVAEAFGWREGLGALALLSLLCAVAFNLLVPKARNFRPVPLQPRAVARTVGSHLRNPLLLRLYAIGMLIMMVFGAVYTVMGFRLTAQPFGLSQGFVGSIFVIYLVGTVASAGSGWLNAKLGRRGTLYLGIGTTSAGLLLSLSDQLALVLLGLVLITAGFFAGHAVASGSVSSTAKEGRAQASGLYQVAYYGGSSIGAVLGAVAYADGGWGATVGLTLAAMAGAACVTLYATRQAVRLRRRQAAAGSAAPRGAGSAPGTGV